MYRAAPALGDRKLLPNLLGYNEVHHVTITEALEDNWSWLDRYDVRSPWSIEIFAQVATGLALWHQASQSLTGLEPATPWLLGVLRSDTREASLHQRGLDEILVRILGHADLYSSLDKIVMFWASEYVIHADLRLTNVMFHTDGSIRLVDWEASRWGDPR